MNQYEVKQRGCIDPLLNFPKLMTGLTMFSKPLPSTAAWPKAIVSPEEIDALLHGVFPLSTSPLIANPCGSAGLGAVSWPDSGELRQSVAEISVDLIL
ncbi:hypothetical protein [Limnohabitans sp.]|uniref:hypothetical protein n=1 Tax=Limnohabitans sp. TaxID=1907725 RepID=UPI002896FCF1|nr:hypothetical protein [Limnohabitans sp.]